MFYAALLQVNVLNLIIYEGHIVLAHISEITRAVM